MVDTEVAPDTPPPGSKLFLYFFKLRTNCRDSFFSLLFSFFPPSLSSSLVKLRDWLHERETQTLSRQSAVCRERDNEQTLREPHSLIRRLFLKLSSVCLSLIAAVSSLSGHSLTLLTASVLFLCCFASPLWNVLTELSNAESQSRLKYHTPAGSSKCTLYVQ